MSEKKMYEMSKSKAIEKQKVREFSDEQRERIYKYATEVRPETLEELCPALLNVCLNSEKGLLKNELGKVIFHLQKTERLESKIGLQKLLDASLRVNPEKTFRILESATSDAKELAKNIKTVL